MKKYLAYLILAFIATGFVAKAGVKVMLNTHPSPLTTDNPAADLKVIFVRHGEKPDQVNSLTCQGLNRALQLPEVIKHKFGVPDYLYVPSLKKDAATSHARMFETATPLAVKYNVDINSKFDEQDFAGIAADIKTKTGTVLVVWEHKAIIGIINALGANAPEKWHGDDFDSIWIVTFVNGVPTFSSDREGLNPSEKCP